ncbi:MAG: ATP-binding protein, partial [Alphaproteobacteria bacterium]|nr:ATP-binding protein [Alphaproteobacteria bacterium]
DFTAQPSVDKKQIREIAAGRFIANAEAVLLLGPPCLRHEAHLATSLKDKGALIGIFWLRAAPESGAGIEPGQLGRGDRPRCALADLPRLDGAAADQPEHRHLADGETPRRLVQR